MDTNTHHRVRNAVFLGGLCSLAYLAVYLARNILSAVTPQMLEGGYPAETFSSLSSLFFVMYAVGQLINGAVGDRIRARYMMSFGLVLAGICTLLFPFRMGSPMEVRVLYGLTGFFLSMIYAPMTRVIAENTEPLHAVRCTLGLTAAAFFGSPLAGAAAAVLAWQSVFYVSAGALFVMGALCFLLFLLFERRGIVTPLRTVPAKRSEGGWKLLLRHRILRFTLISVLTGIIRTTVVFWMPTYFSLHLGFSAEQSAGLFTAATLVIALSAFASVFAYERLGQDLHRILLLSFGAAGIFFLLAGLISLPLANIVCFVLAVFSSNCAATMLWSRYCPGLRDTGMVSTATGYLDFMSYMAAAVSSALFADAVERIGWQKLILLCALLMAVGAAASRLPRERR